MTKRMSENYKGRELAFIKHELLKNYLERLFMIVGQHEKTICYVDCFAGPWKEESEDLEDTSIGISLAIMQGCAKSLGDRGKRVKFKALYVEKDPKAFNKLQSFLDKKKYDEVKTDCIHAEFSDSRSEILDWCGTKDFTFFFIDPTGWKDGVEVSTLQPLLKRSKSEFLINFMYDFVVRAHNQLDHSLDMKNIFGEVPNTDGMNSKEREAYLFRLYRENLKSVLPLSGMTPRSVVVPIFDRIKNRTKYGLVYLTRHEKGIIEFMKASEKLDLIQRQVRAQTRQDSREKKTGMADMFDDSYSAGVVKNDLSLVKDYWLGKLSTTPKRYGNVELADMFEDTGWFFSDFQAAFKELQVEGKVENKNFTNRRTKNFVNFGRKEYLRKLIE